MAAVRRRLQKVGEGEAHRLRQVGALRREQECVLGSVTAELHVWSTVSEGVGCG
jgi:hypothetical protein